MSNKMDDIESVKNKLNSMNFHDDRDHFNIVFIGHVDAGKSTTCGQILLLTGQADERVIEKYKELAVENNRESWWIAYIMDTNEEERDKGKTVEVGMANFSTEKRRYSILDAPGHKNYVPAMISGASQADIGILVISARKGEFEAGFQRGGQTREHSLLSKTLGITKIIIAVNKMDDETVNWNQDRYNTIIKKTTTFLKQCGYRTKDISSLPMSGLKGQGIIKPVPKEICPWNKSVGLLNLLDQQNIPRIIRDELRIPVVDRYRDMGCVVVIGKVESGVITNGDKLIIMPNKIELTCESISIDDDKVVKAKSGENVNIYLKGCEVNDISSGDMICDIKFQTKRSNFLECQIYITELLPHKPLLTTGYSSVFHAHSVVTDCEITRLGVKIDKNKKPKKIQFAKAQSKVLCRLKLSRIISIEKYNEFPQLGRFTLRDEGKTIAIGRVLELL